MPKEKYIVELNEAEKNELLEHINRGQTAARQIKRANILLLADKGKTDPEIVKSLHTSLATVHRTRQRFVEGNLEFALNEKRRSGRPLEFNEKQEAYLVALACSQPPEGQCNWTMQLLANRLIELQVVDKVSDETVRLRLKKTKSSPGNTTNGVFLKLIWNLFGAWKMCLICMLNGMTPYIQWSVLMRPPTS
jgi:transposase